MAPPPVGAAFASASHFTFADQPPAVGTGHGLLHDGRVYGDIGTVAPAERPHSATRRRRPGSAGSRRSARPAGSSCSTPATYTLSGLLPEEERRREAGFDARSTATEQMRGVIPPYDALRDKNLPAMLKDKMLRSSYAAAAHARKEQAQAKHIITPTVKITQRPASAPHSRRPASAPHSRRPASAGRRRPTSTGRRRPASAGKRRPASAGRRPSSAGRRVRPSSAGHRRPASLRAADSASTAKGKQKLEATRLRVAELWEELHIPERERQYYKRKYFSSDDTGSVDNLMRLSDALEEHRSKTLQMLKCVDLRESQLQRLKDLSESIVQSSNSGEKTVGMVDEMSNLLDSLNLATFSCCEAITEWRRGLCQPQAFLWRGMNYILKMKDDMQVINAAAQRLSNGTSADGAADEFTKSRRQFANKVMNGEESLQQKLFEENDELLRQLQWMPTLNIQVGSGRPKPIQLSQDEIEVCHDGAATACTQEPTDEAVTPSGGARDTNKTQIDWDQVETAIFQCFHDTIQIRRGESSGIVSKTVLRRKLMQVQAGGSKAATKIAVGKLWKHIGALYGRLIFDNVSLDELSLGLAACNGKPIDPRVVSCPLLTPEDTLTFGLRVAFTEIFRRFDIDTDGALSRGELNAFQRSVHGVPLDKATLNWIYKNHHVNSAGNLTLTGFLSCVQEQLRENKAAIIWELRQLGYTVDEDHPTETSNEPPNQPEHDTDTAVQVTGATGGAEM